MSKHSKPLETVRDVVAALGGPAAVAKLLNVGPTAVFNWVSFDAVPPKWFFAISDALAERGLSVSRDLFRAQPRRRRLAHAS